MNSYSQNLVIGAGVAGLACARLLRDQNHECLVLERASKVGGRAASRYVDGQPVDYGPVFVHGNDTSFLAMLKESRCTLIPWPTHVEGHGAPFQKCAFAAGEARFAIREGINSLPQFLAEGLDVRCQSGVESLELRDGLWLAHSKCNGTFCAHSLILGLAAEQACALIKSSPTASDAFRPIIQQLSSIRSLACLTVWATYEEATSLPPWDVLYPQDSTGIKLISFNSRKRSSPASNVMVVQSHDDWARERLQDSPDLWAKALLSEASRYVGSWAVSPCDFRAHRWTYANIAPSEAQTLPAVVPLSSGAKLGLAGDYLSKTSGLESAWLSGRRVAWQLSAL